MMGGSSLEGSATVRLHGLMLNVSRNNFQATLKEVDELEKRFGMDIHKVVLRVLIDHINFAELRAAQRLQTPEETAYGYMGQWLRAEIESLAKTTLFPSVLVGVLKNQVFSLQDFFEGLQLPFPLEILTSLSLAHRAAASSTSTTANSNTSASDGVDADAAGSVRRVVRAHLDRVYERVTDVTAEISKWQDKLFEPSLHRLLYYLNVSDASAVLSDSYRKKTLLALRKTFPAQVSKLSNVLLKGIAPADGSASPMLTAANSNVSGSPSDEETIRLLGRVRGVSKLADMAQDLGFSATTSPAVFDGVLSKFGSSEITADDVAELITMMCRTHAAQDGMGGGVDDDLPLTSVLSMAAAVANGFYLGSTPAAPSPADRKPEDDDVGGGDDLGWRVDVVVKALLEKCPSMQWKEVLKRLDRRGFGVDRAGFVIVTRAWRLATQGKELFPLSILFSKWTYRAGQLSFLAQAIEAPSTETFSLLKSHTHSLLPGLALTSCPVPTGVATAEAKNESAATQPALLRRLQKYYSAWLSLDLIRTLILLGSNDDLSGHVRPLFARAIEGCPAILISGLLHVRAGLVAERERHSKKSDASEGAIMEMDDRMRFLDDIMSHALIQFSKDPAALNSRTLISALWKLNHEGLTAGLVRTWRHARAHILFVYTMTVPMRNSTVKPLQYMLDTTPHAFAIDLAVYASVKKVINVEKWLKKSSCHSERGPAFVTTCLSFIQNYVDAPNKSTSPVPLTVDLLAVFFKVLLDPQTKAVMTPETAAVVQQVYSQSCTANPVLVSLASTVDAVEEKANTFFQKLYRGDLAMMDAIDMLKRFKASDVKEEREIYAFMVHNIFDEYRHFPKYPSKFLRISGVFFGLLIQHQLVSSFTLGIALRYVLEALRESDKKMFRFGMWALEQFKDRLHQWPRYCALITSIPHLRSEFSSLAEFLDKIVARNGGAADGSGSGLGGGAGSGFTASLNASGGAAGEQRVGSSTSSFAFAGGSQKTLGQTVSGSAKKKQSAAASAAATLAAAAAAAAVQEFEPGNRQGRRLSKNQSSLGFGSTMSIDTLLSVRDEEQHPEPSESTKDKVHFIVNNVTMANLSSKGRELMNVLEPQYFPYFARYLVITRVSIENKFQNVYAAFIESLKNRVLLKHILNATYANITVLVGSEKVLHSSTERSLLKNLGTWLGLLTISQNRPVVANRIHFKHMLLDAYELGRLIAVIPFVAKVLESCQRSVVFKPPNPWLMGIVGLLAEIFHLPGLKLNLKFEIEVLFNNLNVEMKDVSQSSLLKEMKVSNNNLRFGGASGGVVDAFSVASSLGGGLQIRSPAGAGGESAGASGTQSLETSDATQAETPLVRLANAVGIAGSGSGLFDANSGGEVVGGQGLSGGVRSADGAEQPEDADKRGFVQIHPSIPLFQMFPQLKPVVPRAIDRAISEIISPVVERSVTIACVTAREFILKDFAMEPDENRMRTAARHMVQYLTRSLALVTCKEPLRVSITNHLNALFAQSAVEAERSMLEFACLQVSRDNLDMGCGLIEKAAAERAIRAIDDAMAQAYEARRKAREAGQQYFDMSYLQQGGAAAAALPDMLKPTPGSSPKRQLQVYEDFARLSTIAVDGGLHLQQPDASGPDALLQRQQQEAGGDGSGGSSGVPVTAQQTLDRLISLLASLEQSVTNIATHEEVSLSALLSGDQREGSMQIENVLRVIPAVLNQVQIDDPVVPRDVVVFTFAHKVFKRLYDPRNRVSELMVDVLTRLLVSVQQFSGKLKKELTGWVLFPDDDAKFVVNVFVALVRAGLLDIAEVDAYFAKSLHSVHASGQIVQVVTAPAPSSRAQQPQQRRRQQLHPHVEYVLTFVRRLVVKERLLSGMQLVNVLDALGKIGQALSRQGRHKALTDALGRLLEEVHTASVASSEQQPRGTAGGDVGEKLSDVERGYPGDSELDVLDRQGPDAEVPQSLRQQIVYLLDDWMCICLNQGTTADKTYAQFLQVLQQQQHVLVESPEALSRFFRVVTSVCVQSSFNEVNAASGAGSVQLNFTGVDALAKLVVFLVKFFDPSLSANKESGNPVAVKIRLLSSFLTASAKVLRSEADRLKGAFNQRPYLRVYSILLQDLNTPDPTLDSSNVDVLMALGHCFHLLRPARVPAFSFAWLELVSHRMFMPKLLIPRAPPCATLFVKLLKDALAFMYPSLRSAELNDSMRLMYKGVLRVILVLLHDFPEFLCEQYCSLCDVVPNTCVQMRNLILSAFPTNMRLPDPLTPNLKVDLLPEINQAPRIASDVNAALVKHGTAIQAPLDAYLKNRGPAQALNAIVRGLYTEGKDGNGDTVRHYNIPLINSLVLYVGTRGIALQRAKQPTEAGRGFNDPAVDIFEALVTYLDHEGRYLVLNGMANHLRYPNSHTHYFSCVILSLFLKTNSDMVMNQITRVLLERLIVHRPHPWGLLITLIELIKNERYEFWKQPFTRCSPEIENLFESVALSCMPGTRNQGGGGGIGNATPSPHQQQDGGGHQLNIHQSQPQGQVGQKMWMGQQ